MLHTLTFLLALSQSPPLEKLPPDAQAKADIPAKVTPVKPTSDFRSFSVRTAYELDRRDAFGRVVTTTQYGSGTVVKVEPKRLLVLACDHTVRDDVGNRHGRLYVTAADGKRRLAKVLHHNTAADLSVIEVPGESFSGVSAATVAASETYAHDTAVVKAGFPGAGAFHLSRGFVKPVTSHSTADPSIVNTIATANARSGDSGGGLFREGDMALVGVVWGGREDGLRASRLREVHAILAKAGVVAEPKAETIAKAPTPVKDDTPVKVPDGKKPGSPPVKLEDAAGKAAPFTLTVQGGSRDVLDLTRKLKAGRSYRVTVEEVAAEVPVKDVPPVK